MMRLLWLIALLLLLACCAGKAPIVKVEPPPRPDDGLVTPQFVLPQPQPAAWSDVDSGDPAPLRMVREQQPRLRPCWTFGSNSSCLEPAQGLTLIVGRAQGLSTSADALDAARLDAARQWIDDLLAHRGLDEQSPREMLNTARAALERLVFSAMFAPDQEHQFDAESFWQRWEERREGRARTYYNAYLLLEIPDEVYLGRRKSD